jgi:hypothetical protein
MTSQKYEIKVLYFSLVMDICRWFGGLYTVMAEATKCLITRRSIPVHSIRTTENTRLDVFKALEIMIAIFFVMSPCSLGFLYYDAVYSCRWDSFDSKHEEDEEDRYPARNSAEAPKKLYNNRNRDYWDFGLCPPSGILKNISFLKVDLFLSSDERFGGTY